MRCAAAADMLAPSSSLARGPYDGSTPAAGRSWRVRPARSGGIPSSALSPICMTGRCRSSRTPATSCSSASRSGRFSKWRAMRSWTRHVGRVVGECGGASLVPASTCPLSCVTTTSRFLSCPDRGACVIARLKQPPDTPQGRRLRPRPCLDVTEANEIARFLPPAMARWCSVSIGGACRPVAIARSSRVTARCLRARALGRVGARHARKLSLSSGSFVRRAGN